jgi:ribulose-phosphate 3-epimerase
VDRPEEYLQSVVEAGADSVTVHFEASRYPYRLLTMLKDMGVKAGLAFNAATPVEGIIPALDALDLVHLMTAEPAGAGSEFMPEMLAKIAKAHDLCAGRSIEIEVDGGINSRNIAPAAKAGATIFVVGRAVWDASNPVQAISELRATAGS